MQSRVRQRFSQLQAQDERDGQVPWHVVNAAQTVEEVQKEINDIVEATIERVQGSSDESSSLPLQLMWQNRDDEENKEN